MSDPIRERHQRLQDFHGVRCASHEHMPNDRWPCDAERMALRVVALTEALIGYEWLWNNIHNADTERFRTLFQAAHEDAERALAADKEATS